MSHWVYQPSPMRAGHVASGVYAPSEYHAELNVDGKPLTICKIAGTKYYEMAKH